LSLLIAEYIEKVRMQTNPIVSGFRLHAIHSHTPDHNCPGHYNNCEGQRHQVDLVRQTACNGSAGNAVEKPRDWPDWFNLIIIRHGIDFKPPSQQLKAPFVDLPRQTMAYDYPQ
jgi:hypothetical protein